ncbi:MAG: hypothetical protein QOE70_2826 [Chthoniobacter sp.]|jgi:repressor LexA|nr:hypothetical protein [Chthoniobacter sp.]
MKHSNSDIPIIRQAKTHLQKAAAALTKILGLDPMLDPTLAECPLEVQDAMESAIASIQAALACLDTAEVPPQSSSPKKPKPSPDDPTRQQGQFLAYIREYMMRNYAGVAPTHAALQRFFDLTPPSVNSMLIRLEQRGFIRRIPHQARAIQLTIAPERIPPLERPFKA